MVAPAPAALTAAEPVPVAVVARTSTLALQTPSHRYGRQLRSCQAWLPAGWFIAAVYSDVESGATDLDARSRTGSWRVLTDAGCRVTGAWPTCSPKPPAPAPVSPWWSARTSNAGRPRHVQRAAAGKGTVPQRDTDVRDRRAADIAGVNATTVLVRRVEAGGRRVVPAAAQGEHLERVTEHNADGWNIGTPPYGYAAERHPHPNPLKASQGRTKTRLIIDPATRPAP